MSEISYGRGLRFVALRANIRIMIVSPSLGENALCTPVVSSSTKDIPPLCIANHSLLDEGLVIVSLLILEMVTHNMLRTHVGKKVFSEKKSNLNLDLIKCFKQII